MKKQTAVEWLVSELISKGIVNLDAWIWDDNVSIVDITKQAKEMERERIEEAYQMGREGLTITEFNETFKSE
jgi:hypothetical protein